MKVSGGQGTSRFRVPTASVRSQTAFSSQLDFLAFSGNGPRRNRGSKIRNALTIRAIGLLTPIMAMTGCGLSAQGKPLPEEEPENTSDIPASVDSPTGQTGADFFNSAMALNDTTAALPAGTPTPPAPTELPEPPATSTPATPAPTSTPAPEAPSAPPPSPTEAPTATPEPQPDPPQAGSDGWLDLMSQNVLHSHLAKGRHNWEARIGQVADIIRQNNAEVITLQETSPEQFRKLTGLLGPEYQSFPGHYTNKDRLSENTIFYKAKNANGQPVWKLEDSGHLDIPNSKSPTRPRSQPWARLVHAGTGQEVIIISLHAVAHDAQQDPGGALKREESGNLIAEWARTMKAKHPNAVVIASGDINTRDRLRSKDRVLNGNRDRTIPCIIGKELRAADDVQAGRSGPCPISNAGIDQVFSNSKDARQFHYVQRGQSDHAALLVDLELPA